MHMWILRQLEACWKLLQPTDDHKDVTFDTEKLRVSEPLANWPSAENQDEMWSERSRWFQAVHLHFNCLFFFFLMIAMGFFFFSF